MASVLTPFQITATANLLYNQGISTNAIFLTNIATYENLPYVSALREAITTSTTANLAANSLSQLYTLGTNTCPALSDSIPSSSTVQPTKELFTTLLAEIANSYISSSTGKDVSVFCQGFSALAGYNGVTNNFINSAVNSQTYLGGIFPGNNSLVSGGITDVNVCTELWGSDLRALGGLINLSNLAELGTPLALIKQIAAIGGITPELSIAFANEGVSQDTVVKFISAKATATDSEQKAMYNAMTQITGTVLTQVLTLLGVTTPNINTMADLLNPYKIFPNSFQSLTVTGVNGVTQNIYIDSAGTVNATVKQFLPRVALNTLS
jgi:hypothetical protein